MVLVRMQRVFAPSRVEITCGMVARSARPSRGGKKKVVWLLIKSTASGYFWCYTAALSARRWGQCYMVMRRSTLAFIQQQLYPHARHQHFYSLSGSARHDKISPAHAALVAPLSSTLKACSQSEFSNLQLHSILEHLCETRDTEKYAIQLPKAQKISKIYWKISLLILLDLF